MAKWGLHERTTEEQARVNRGRRDNGKISQVEDITPLDDDYDVNIGWRVVEWFMMLPDPTNAQAGLVSVVTGAMTGAFAVWLSHEKDK